MKFVLSVPVRLPLCLSRGHTLPGQKLSLFNCLLGGRTRNHCSRSVLSSSLKYTASQSGRNFSSQTEHGHGHQGDEDQQKTSRKVSFSKLFGYTIGIALGSFVAFKITDLFAKEEEHPSAAMAEMTLQRMKEVIGAPCVVASVWVDGRPTWKSSCGFADVENCTPCSVGSVMRIASISKPMTSVLLGNLLEENKVDLDKPIQTYVPDFPKKHFEDKTVEITLRQLLSHISGVRGYQGRYKNVSTEDRACTNEEPISEFYCMDHFKSAKEALCLFDKDPLLSKPGTKFCYSTLTYSLIAAAIENVRGDTITNCMKLLFKDLGLLNTYVEDHDDIIDQRTSYYVRDSAGVLKNSMYVDCSYKVAGGGILSTVDDLNKFGSAVLYAYQGGLKGILKAETVRELWTIEPLSLGTSKKYPRHGFGLGWQLSPANEDAPAHSNNLFAAYHTGCSVGCSSIMFVVPRGDTIDTERTSQCAGVVVSILANREGCDLKLYATKLATLFGTR